MSLYPVVLAAGGPLTPEEARRMFEHCTGFRAHREGEFDPRIVAFHNDLTARFPDHEPYDWAASPWVSAPLSTGLDHVIMSLSFGARSDPAIKAICELAERHELVVFDP